MPFNRPPTMSLRTAERPKQRVRPRRAETASPPRRSNTRKVNVVSQASLAMLNPAYAMGIEAGPSWQEEEEARWHSERAKNNRRIEGHPPRTTAAAPSPSLRVEQRSPWSMSPTPELEAFLSDEPLESQLAAPQDGGDALGLNLYSTEMARKISSESVFEDEDPSPGKRRPNASNNSSTLSRFFTWKRSPRGKNVIPLPPSSSANSSSNWDIPQSAPPHIEYFDLPDMSASTTATSIDPSTFSSPNTPVDIFTRPLPSSTSVARSMSRKISMPTLRDIRRAAANAASTVMTPHDVSLPEIKSHDTSSSFFWRSSSEEPKTPTMGTTMGSTMGSSGGSLTPSSSNNSSLSGRLTPQTSHRISSLGRGLASPRKSTVEVPMTDDTPSPSPTRLVNKKKVPQLYSSRNEPSSMRNLPPLPTNISIASLVAAEEEEERKLQQGSSSTCSSGSPTATTMASRRRSRSVGAISDSFASLTTENRDNHSLDSQHAFRVSLAKRSMIGTASPKLLIRDAASPTMMNHSNSPLRTKDLLKVIEPQVVVNVMPPTPDLGANEQETFECNSINHQEEAKCETEVEMSSLVEEHSCHNPGIANDSFPESQASMVSSNDCNREKHIDEQDHCSLQRSDSIRSDVSDSTICSADSHFTEDFDEPFGFARSMSTMSLASDSSSESDSTCSQSQAGDEDDEDGDCKEAQIMSASSTISSFSRAHFVSPRMRELSGWNSINGGNNNSINSSPSNKSFVSLASNPSPQSIPQSQIKRKSKRLSSIAGQNLANVMSGTGKDSPVEYQKGRDLSSPVELQNHQADEADCDTPRLGSSAVVASIINPTKPLNVKKNNGQQQQSVLQGMKQESPVTMILSPPRLFPRAHNAESPHLELDLSLPLDLHDIGPIIETREVASHRERPRVPQKSRARATLVHKSGAITGEPKTPPSTNRLMSSVMQEGRHRESFGLGLGLGLELENAMDLKEGHLYQVKKQGSPSPPNQNHVLPWQRQAQHTTNFVRNRHHHTPNASLSSSHVGFAM